MIREAKEESGLEVKMNSGRVFEFNDRYGRAIGLPYLLASVSDRVTLTEHVEELPGILARRSQTYNRGGEGTSETTDARTADVAEEDLLLR